MTEVKNKLESAEVKVESLVAHAKYLKLIKGLVLKILLVDLVFIIVGWMLLAGSEFTNDYATMTTAGYNMWAIGCLVESLGLIGLLVSCLVILTLSIIYHVHNAGDLHGKKDSKSSKNKKK